MDKYRIFYRIMFLTAASLCKTSATNGPLTVGTYPYDVDLDDNYNLKWNFNSTHIIFQCKVQTQGYVGFGISAHGDMYPGDMVIAWLAGSQVHFHDRHAQGRRMPDIDEQQDWNLLELEEDGGYYTLTVVRKLNTCDEEGDLAIQDGTTRVIYAYNDNVPASDDSIHYHGASTRGVKSLLLLDPPPLDIAVSDLPDDVTTHEFANDNYAVPSKDTTYSCLFKKFEPAGGKHHLIRTEPMVQEGQEELIHHMILYSCNGSIDDSLLDTPFECYTEDPLSENCYFIFVGWAIGGTAIDYPSHVGVSLGTSEDPTYFKLEIHYDNVDLRNDLVDSSGLRFYMTQELRDHDAGMLQVGVVVGTHQAIPPGYDAFLSRGICAPECFETDVGDEGITIFADTLHSHLIGAKLQSRLIRNGVELPPIAKDDNYDFNYQETRLLHEERILKKGDMLITDCIYDSSQRSNVTYGGLSSREEMCLAFVMYYPRMSLNTCLTMTMYSKNGDPMYADANFLNTTDWSDEGNRQSFARNVLESDTYDLCLYTDQQKDLYFQSSSRTFTQYVQDNTCGGGSLSCHVMALCACVISLVVS